MSPSLKSKIVCTPCVGISCYKNREDAEKAKKLMRKVNGRPVQIMFANRKPTLKERKKKEVTVNNSSEENSKETGKIGDHRPYQLIIFFI